MLTRTLLMLSLMIFGVAPVAAADGFVVAEDTVLAGNVLADNGNGTDIDADGDPLTVSLMSGTTQGTLALNPDGTFKDEAGLRAAFADAGIDLDRPVVTTCGSGVTAAVLLFAMHLLGKDDVALYDGSWSEWGADPATPKATGPAA